MKKLISLILSCAVILSSVFLFNITSLGVNETTLDEFSADIADIIAEYGMEPSVLNTESADLYSDADYGFETCRLIVKSNQKVDPLNSVAAAGSFNGLQVFQFETPYDAKAAYEYYISLDCVEFAEADKVFDINDTYEAEYPYDYKTNYISWGPEYIGFDELNNYIVDNNISLAPVKVAIIDSGINHTRAEFAGRIEDTGFNNSDSGKENSTADDNGHGTLLASIIIDCTFSNVIICPYKTFNSKGKSTAILIATAIFEVHADGCDIINMSFGQMSESVTVLNAVDYVQENSDILMTAAIGNEGTDSEEFMPTPAISDHVIGVSSINKNGLHSSFSNYSKKYVELTAPGEKIRGATKYDSTYTTKNGTSLSTPFVSAVAAAALSLNPSLSSQSLRTLLSETAIPVFTDRQNLGYFGNGLVYAMGTLQALPGAKFAAPPVFNYESGRYDSSVKVTLSAQDGAKIYYTTDGTIPTEKSNLYSGEITVDSETGILAAAYIDGFAKSPVSSAHYRIVKDTDSSLISVDDNGYIISYSGDYADIRIPETATSVSGNTVTVKGIGESVFESNLYLKSAILPESITDFKNKAFYGCENLEEINISSAIYIGDSAFYRCKSLNAVNIPNIKTIGSYAFYEAATVNCEPFSISSEKITSIGEGSFASTPITHFYVPNATGSIGDYTFRGCESLVEVYMPYADKIGNEAFADCKSLTDCVFDNALSVGEKAFLNCKSIKSLSLKSAESVGNKAFHGCTSLCCFSLESVKSIYFDCFTDISESVTALILPELETVFDVEEASFPKNIVTFYAPKLKNIPSNAFKNNRNLSEITLGSVETIGNHAFYYCSSLTEIDLSTVKSIGEYAFYSCSGLTEVDLSSLQILGKYGFNNCSKLKAFDMPELLDMGAYSFYGTKLNYLSAPKATTVSQNALTIDGDNRPIKIDLSSLKRITLYNFFSNNYSCFVLASLEEGNFYVGGTVYHPADSAATPSRKRSETPVIFKTSEGYGYSYLPESAAVPDILYVSAAGLNLTYQWYTNRIASLTGAVPIEGAESPELELLTAPDAQYYFCKVTMTDNGISNSVYSSFVKNNSYLGGAKRADYSALLSAIEATPSYMKHYTEESVAELHNTINSVDYNLTSEQQSIVDGKTHDIIAATKSLVIKDADYSLLQTKLAEIPEDMSIYTAESAAAVEYAVQSITYGLNIKSQFRVDTMALRLADKLSRLEVAPADYSELDALISTIPNLDLYTEKSVEELNTVLNSINRNLLVTEQKKIDEYIKNLADAISKLELINQNIIELEKIIASVPENLENYTDESVQALAETLSDIQEGKKTADSQQIDEYINRLSQAIKNLKLKSADYAAVNSALSEIPEDLSIYTDETVAALNAAVNAVDYNLDITQQSKVDGFATNIIKATESLKLKKADYAAVSSALSEIPEDLSIYTDESVALLNSAVNAVDYNLDITQQSKVDGFAINIIKATESLKLKKADYAPVSSALSEIPEDLSIYTDETIAALNSAVNAVDYNLDITQQSEVDGFAINIIKATDNLKPKKADYAAVSSALSEIPKDLSIYTDETVAALNSAVNAVDYNLDITQQSKVDGYAKAIKKAASDLTLKKSDLSALNSAIALVPTDLSVYTEESVAALEAILGEIDYELAESDQNYADECAESVKKAVENLKVEHWFIRLIKFIIRFFINLFN